MTSNPHIPQLLMKLERVAWRLHTFRLVRRSLWVSLKISNSIILMPLALPLRFVKHQDGTTSVDAWELAHAVMSVLHPDYANTFHRCSVTRADGPELWLLTGTSEGWETMLRPHLTWQIRLTRHPTLNLTGNCQFDPFSSDSALSLDSDAS
ncbi:unnamed protein product [Rhizoctonia solani]|uniref:Uncharacterized protein n=1 Tax=Rhizoctonia solani TaxID=456999 RepID=A0A8H3GTU0_9AGAM|nr:unnamed protein product [Rhizoctonia solani]